MVVTKDLIGCRSLHLDNPVCRLRTIFVPLDMPLSGQEKVVNVKMPKKCHQIEQVLKSQYDLPMGDVMYYPARHEIHKQAVYCKWMAQTLDAHGIEIDPHAHKECYGFWCKNCLHEGMCRVGRYDGVLEVDEKQIKKWGTNAGRKKIASIQVNAGQTPQGFLFDLDTEEEYVEAT